MWSLILRRPLFVIILAIASMIASHYLGSPLISVFQSRDCDPNRNSNSDLYQGRRTEGYDRGPERRFERQDIDALRRHQAWERYRNADSEALRRHQHQEWRELRQRRQQERAGWRDDPRFEPRSEYQYSRAYRGDN